MHPHPVRQALLEDIISILDLFRQTIEWVCAEHYTDEQIRIWIQGACQTQKWINRIEEQYFIISTSAGSLTGFASISVEGYLDLLYVHKHWQGKGAGKTLYTELERFASDHEIPEIYSDVSLSAVPFFTKMGFQILKSQSVVREGVALQNFRMIKKLEIAP